MHTRSRVIVGLALAAVAGTAAGEVSRLKGFCREGQTFLTWAEDPAVTGEWYKVYVSDRPITAADLGKARCVARIPEGSNRFGFLRNLNTTRGFFKDLAAKDWCQAIQIQDDEKNAKRLPDGTGLFVRTIKQPGRSYYAVTVEAAGKEAKQVKPGESSLTQPVAEEVETPGAVLLKKLGDRYWIYAFFCDYELWNPDGVEDNWDGYAHVFHIRAPSPKRKDTKEPYPVSFRLHAYTAWRGWNIPYCYPATHVDVRLLDYHLTWWYGYSDALPKTLGRRRGPPPGTVVNFTERRVLQVARWLAKQPRNFPFRVDPQQFSVFGGSMGGTGAHYLGCRHGDVFAAAFADEGIHNWALSRRYNSWVNNVVAKFGPPQRNDMTNEGLRVYDLLNLDKWVAERPERELPFMSIGQGIIDFVIPFHTCVDYWRGLEKGKHPFAASWEMAGHSPWVGSGSPMDYRKIRRDEPIPAFANASCNTPLRSGFRILSSWDGLTDDTLTIKPGSIKGTSDHVNGSFPPNLAGKTLVLGPSGVNPDRFTIRSSTATELTVEKGSLLEYLPPLTRWNLHVLKQNIRKTEGKTREPTDAEKRAAAQRRKKTFLICDGSPRGCWNGHFAWSTRNQNFDPKSAEDDIVDEPKRFAICIRLAKHRRSSFDGDTATADVTPRRCRNFTPAPGEKVHWENWDVTDPAKPKKRDEGDVTADPHALVTVPKFIIARGGWGSRLVLTRP